MWKSENGDKFSHEKQFSIRSIRSDQIRETSLMNPHPDEEAVMQHHNAPRKKAHAWRLLRQLSSLLDYYFVFSERLLLFPSREQKRCPSIQRASERASERASDRSKERTNERTNARLMRDVDKGN